MRPRPRLPQAILAAAAFLLAGVTITLAFAPVGPWSAVDTVAAVAAVLLAAAGILTLRRAAFSAVPFFMVGVAMTIVLKRGPWTLTDTRGVLVAVLLVVLGVSSLRRELRDGTAGGLTGAWSRRGERIRE